MLFGREVKDMGTTVAVVREMSRVLDLGKLHVPKTSFGFIF